MKNTERRLEAWGVRLEGGDQRLETGEEKWGRRPQIE
jgi:hypothetical protein